MSDLDDLAKYLASARWKANDGPTSDLPQMREHVKNLERYMRALDAARSVEPAPDLRELIAGAQNHIGHGTDLVRRLYNEQRPADAVLGDWMQYAMTYMKIAYQCSSPDARPPISNAKWFEEWRSAHPVAGSPSVEPAPADSVPMPQNEDQAAMMALLGESWLRENAPHRLRFTPEPNS